MEVNEEELFASLGFHWDSSKHLLTVMSHREASVNTVTLEKIDMTTRNASLTTPSSTIFETPDGPRCATVIDGAHVIGDVVPTEQGIEALRDLIAAARKKLKADGPPRSINEMADRVLPKI